MGRIEWFRRWRYEESAWLAQDQELLLRSYRLSRFANLPQVLLGYRRERISLRKLFYYKILHIRYVCRQPGAVSGVRQKMKLMAILSGRFAANCRALPAYCGKHAKVCGLGPCQDNRTGSNQQHASRLSQRNRLA